jgi:hypothetical protein
MKIGLIRLMGLFFLVALFATLIVTLYFRDREPPRIEKLEFLERVERGGVQRFHVCVKDENPGSKASLMLNGTLIEIPLTERRGGFACYALTFNVSSVFVKEGRVTGKLTVSDAGGNSNSVNVSFYVNLEAPRIESVDVEKLENGVFMVSANVSDENLEGVYLVAGGEVVPLVLKNGKFEGIIKTPRDVNFTILAYDRFNNTSTYEGKIKARKYLYLSRGLTPEQVETFLSIFPTNDNETWLSFAELWGRNTSLGYGAFMLYGSVSEAVEYLRGLEGGMHYLLVVVDVRGIGLFDPRLYTLVTLQGLVNRERPNLYVIFKDEDAFWLRNVARDLGIGVVFMRLDEAIGTFAYKASGYVVYDPGLPDTVNVGTTLCGIYDGVLVHPSWIGWLEGLGVKHKLFDLRGNFSDRVSAYEWAFNNLWSKVNHTKLAVASPGVIEYERYGVRFTSSPQVACRDYAVALRLLTVYLDPTDKREKELLEQILASMPVNSMVMGWTDGDEGAYVDIATKYGKYVAVMMHIFGPGSFSNPTAWMHLKSPSSPVFNLPPIRPEVLGKGGVYVTFYITDGDNLQFNQDILPLWSRRAGVPVAWTISPFLLDIAPYMAYYYSKTMSYEDTFVCGPSGAGYIYPVSNMAYLAEYLPYTLNYLKRSGLRIVEVLGYSDEAGREYVNALGITLLAIKRDYNEQPGLFKTHGQSFYYIEADGHYIPILFGALHLKSEGLPGFVRSLEEVFKTYQQKPSPIRLSPAEDLLGFAKAVNDPDSPTGKARYVSPGEKLDGAHTFGPYVTLLPGKYKVRFLLKIQKTTSVKVGVIDVCTNIGKTIIASREVSGSEFREAGKYQWFELEFTLSQPTSNIEFRVWYSSESNAGLYCGLIEVEAPANVRGGLPFVLVVSQPWDISEWRSVANTLKEHPNVTLINLHEFIALVNVEYGYGIAKNILEEYVSAGRISKEKATELNRMLEDALSLYRQGSCYEAVKKMITFYRELAQG